MAATVTTVVLAVVPALVRLLLVPRLKVALLLLTVLVVLIWAAGAINRPPLTYCVLSCQLPSISFLASTARGPICKCWPLLQLGSV